jgi:sulfite reductase beta subunit-like hemoprotein
MLGKSRDIRVEHIYWSRKDSKTIDPLSDQINIWLEENPDVDLLDIKFSTSISGSAEDLSEELDVLLIYKK